MTWTPVRPIVVILGLSALFCVTYSSFTGRPILTIPEVGLLEKIVKFHCEMPEAQKDRFMLSFYNEDQVSEKKSYGMTTVLPGEKEAIITIIVKDFHEGHVVCEAKSQNNTSMDPMVSNQTFFKVIVPVESVHVEVSPLSKEVLEGDEITLHCVASKGTHLSYKWWMNGTQLDVASSRLDIKRAALQDTGIYSCMAYNIFNNSMNFTSMITHKVIQVKEHVLRPEISYTVERNGSQYHASIICHVNSNVPLTFMLYNQTGNTINTVTEALQRASFRIPIVLDQSMGTFYCGAKNDKLKGLSNNLTVHVVPVGGAVTLKVEYEMGQNFEVVGLTLRCGVNHGTHPSYQWFLNGSELPKKKKGNLYRISKEGHTLVLTTTNPDSFGSYYCLAMDSFDFNNNVSSKEFLVDKEVLNHLPIEVVALVFGCFLLVICLLTGCCIYGAIYPIRRTPVKPGFNWNVTDIKIKGEKSEDMEDSDLLKSTHLEDFGEMEVESVDEWPEIEKALQIHCMDEEDPEVHPSETS
ncbi:carcinoembryonic antigen-related cell adhesion molecule 20-like [Arapaima gigas]